MSNRQKNITLTESQQEYIKDNPNVSVCALAKKFKISQAKVSTNLKLMGLSKEKQTTKRVWENNGYFDEVSFGKLAII